MFTEGDSVVEALTGHTTVPYTTNTIDDRTVIYNHAAVNFICDWFLRCLADDAAELYAFEMKTDDGRVIEIRSVQ